MVAKSLIGTEGFQRFVKPHSLRIETVGKSLELFQRLGDIWGSARVHISLARYRLIQSEMKLAREHITQASELLQVVGAEDVELYWIQALIANYRFLGPMSILAKAGKPTLRS